MPARSILELALQDLEGDALAGRVITVTKADGSALGESLYSVVSGGSPVIAPETDDKGTKRLYGDTPRRVKVAFSGISGTVDAELRPDPADMLLNGGVATSTFGVQGLLTASGGLAASNGVSASEDSASSYALTVQHTLAGGTGNKSLIVKDNAGTTILEAASLGGGGTYETSTAIYAPRAVIGNLRNWSTNTDLFVVHNRLTGSPTGSFVPMFVGMDTCTQPTDGFNGVTGIPDEVGISTVVRARNVASGASQNYDGSLRAQEAQMLVFASCGLSRTYGSMEVGAHTALNQDSVIEDPISPDNLYGSYAIFAHSTSQVDTGFGTPQRANFGFMTGGDKGFKHPFCAFDIDGVTRLWSVDQNGKQVSGTIVPRAGSTYNLGGTAAGEFWSAIYGNFHVATSDGNAAGPVITRSNATTTGMFFISGGMGFSGTGVETARYDTTAFQLSKAERLTGVISPTQLAANTDDYNPTGLSTARILRINSSGAINLTGIVAQTAGTILTLLNTGAQVITLKHEVTSSAVNRFNLPSGSDIALAIHQAVEVWYDGTAGRWKKLSG